MHTSRRAAAMALASFLIAAALSVVGASPASADATGRLQTSQNWCLENHISAGLVADFCYSSDWTQVWHLQIVAYVGQDPRYSIRAEGTSNCLVAFASSGRVGTYRCNSAWADQVWAFQYVKIDPSDGLPRFWLRNKHSGRCLGLNLSYNPDAFMTTCADYRDQLWKAPGT